MKTDKIKPYDLIRVRRGLNYSIIGEAISYPAPEHDSSGIPTGIETIFVRLAPGDPTSAVWLPLSDCSPATMRRSECRIVYAEAMGRSNSLSPFPADMLRYDCCIDLRHRPSGVVEIAAVMSTGDKREHPFTIERWNSFGWSIWIRASVRLDDKPLIPQDL